MLIVAILLWALGAFLFGCSAVVIDFGTWENVPNDQRPIIIIVALVWPLIAVYVLNCVVVDIVRNNRKK